jgi:hypothetical protein
MHEISVLNSEVEGGGLFHYTQKQKSYDKHNKHKVRLNCCVTDKLLSLPLSPTVAYCIKWNLYLYGYVVTLMLKIIIHNNPGTLQK